MSSTEKNKFEKGDLVKRMIASHYTNGRRSDAIGVVLRIFYPLARVYFYDPNKEDIWNQSALKKVEKETKSL